MVQKWYLKVADTTLTDFDFELAEPTFYNAVGPDDPNPTLAEEGWNIGGETQDLSNFVVPCIDQCYCPCEFGDALAFLLVF